QLARVAADIVRRYDVDGIHLDRIRYPGNAWSWDSESRAGFGKDPDSNRADWKAYRTDLVNRMVRETFDSVTAVKPNLAYSAAVWGIYFDKWQWKTLAGTTDLMQDSRAWAKDGYMDILVPMTYSRIKEPCARIDWGCMLDEQLGSERDTGRHMYIGIDASKGAREVVSQVRMARSRGATGMALFSYSALANTGAFALLASTVFSEPAGVPVMPWKTQATH
ncbi:MAG TPA: family 10 glycosylhydrolase, partial [Gemmatimonadaceae bacterium]|nr:family 10 glycosylhydrolase [Gemmatimonadaceae bacterium]